MSRCSKMRWLWLALILMVAFLLRVPGVFWGKLYENQFVILEPDEYQHVHLAINFLQNVDPALFTGFRNVATNSLGFSTQIALFGYPLIKVFGEDYRSLFFIGRGLSVFYGLLLVWLVYRLADLIFEDKGPALFAAASMAGFDLAVTYSHYAVPEIPYVFWAYLSVFCCLLLFQKTENNYVAGQVPLTSRTGVIWLCMTLSMGMTLGMKYDFLPGVFFASLVAYQVVQRRISALNAVLLGTISALAALLFFSLSIGFQSGWSGNVKTLRWLADANNDIAKDNHYVYNPALYFVGVAVGVGLPATLLSFSAAWKMRKRPVNGEEERARQMLLVLAFFQLLEFLVLWNLGTPFVRRGLIFLPFVAVLVGNATFHLIQLQKPVRKAGVIFLGLYTLALTGVSQWNFVKDNRFEARDFVLQPQFAGKEIFHDFYTNIPSMPPNPERSQADAILMHESYYSRFWKSFTTPFKMPKCCEEVYHCPSKEECLFYQNILAGASDFQLVKKFEPLDWAPERLLYKRLFGTYETFLGDVLIFEK